MLGRMNSSGPQLFMDEMHSLQGRGMAQKTIVLEVKAATSFPKNLE
jgi:hypothetical protein